MEARKISFEEKRQHRRTIIKGRVYAILSPNWIMPYQIIDISRNGLAFRYSGREDLPEENLRLDIFDEDELCLQGVPAKIISDTALKELAVPMRRCGVQFCDLSDMQLDQLGEFLKRHTIEYPM